MVERPSCGTPRGYSSHRYRREEPCDGCRTAIAALSRRYYAQMPPDARAEKLARASAVRSALTRVGREDRQLYERLFPEPMRRWQAEHPDRLVSRSAYKIIRYRTLRLMATRNPVLLERFLDEERTARGLSKAPSGATTDGAGGPS